MIDKVKYSWREICGARKEVRWATIHTRIKADEKCTNSFHALLKSKGTEDTIQEICTTESTEIALWGGATVSSPQEIAEQAENYCESLLSEKPSEVTARELLLKLFKERPIPISAKMAEGLEARNSPEEVMYVIRKTKRGPGDGLLLHNYTQNSINSTNKHFSYQF